MKIKIRTTPMHRLMAGRINLSLPSLTLALLAFAPPTKAGDAGVSQRAPELPSPVCDRVNAPSGHRLSFHVYALGAQIYRWNGSGWVFIAPEATLYADSCYNGAVGVHYAGPIWEFNDRSKVMAALEERCAPLPGAIPWLLLRATSSSEHGRLGGVTYIQRLNTIGGTAPAEAGTVVGEEAHVPYTAEYYFYRKTQ
jgi:hypothetical protein